MTCRRFFYIYCIQPNYCAYSYNLSAQSSNIPDFRLLRLLLSTFIKSYVMDTHLNCLDLSRQSSGILGIFHYTFFFPIILKKPKGSVR